MKHFFFSVAALALILPVTWAGAQAPAPPPPTPELQPPPPPAPPDGKAGKRQGQHGGREMNQSKAREMLEQVMIARLSNELKLTDEQSVLLMRRFSEARDEKQALGRERTEAIRVLRSTVEQGKDEAALTACMDRVRAADEKLGSHRQRMQEAMGAGLDPWQKGKLVLFMDQFESEIKQMLREAHDRRTGRPFQGMPPAPGMGPRPGMPPGPGMPPSVGGRIPGPPVPNGPAGPRPEPRTPEGPPPAPNPAK